MSVTVGPPTQNAASGRREELAKKMEQLGVDPQMVERVVPNASPDELSLLETLVAKSKLSAVVPALEAMSLDEYREVLEKLGAEYIGTLTGAGISAMANVDPEGLRNAVEELAETARMLRAIPPARRVTLWPMLRDDLRLSLPHYQNVQRAIIETGIAAALDAGDDAVISHLRLEAVPSLDLTVLRMAGEPNPELALRGQIRAARSALKTVLATKTVAQLLQESEKQLLDSMGVGQDVYKANSRRSLASTPGVKTDSHPGTRASLARPRLDNHRYSSGRT